MVKDSATTPKKRMAADTSSSELGNVPICVVCGDRANGMHYRALTCEGCKTFFRRNARNHLNLKCEMGGEGSGGGSCDMDLYTRRHCAACRMKKCLDMGMQIDRLWDKERLKTRKPITKKSSGEKTKVTSPTATASESEKTPPPAVTVLKEEESPGKSEPDKPASPEEGARRSAELAKLVNDAYMNAVTQPLPPRPKAEPDAASFPPCGAAVDGGIPTVQTTTLPHPSPTMDGGQQFLAADPLPLGANPLPFSPPAGQSSRTLDPPGTVPPGVALGTPPGSQPSGSGGGKGGGDSGGMLMSEEMRRTLAANLCFGDLPPFMKGIDTDLFMRAMDLLLGLLKHMINFAKRLPGFLALTTEDQATLVKGSFLEYVLISSASLYNPETKRFESELWPEEAWDLTKADSVGFKEAVQSVVDVAIKVGKLKPSRTELTLLYAISIFTPDRKDLCDSKAVEVLQQELVQALEHVTKETHKTDHVGHFAKMIMLLTDVKSVTDVFHEDVMGIQLQGVMLSPIMHEMFSDEEPSCLSQSPSAPT